MKKIIFSTAVMLSALSFTSCLNSDGESRNEATLTYGGSQCFNRVTDNQTGEVFISTEPQYSFLLDYMQSTITPSMSNIKTAENGSGLQFKLPALKVSTGDDYSYACSGTTIVPEGAAQSYVFDNFLFKVIERSLKTTGNQYMYSPVYNLSYTINSRYSVTVFPARYDMVGTTSATPVTTSGDTESYSTTESIFSLILDIKNQKASLYIYGARFADNQSYVDLYTKELPYTVEANAIRIRTDENVQYKLYDRSTGEVSGAYISDLNLLYTVPSGNNSTVSMRINIADIQGGDGNKEFDVNAHLSYYMPTSSN